MKTKVDLGSLEWALSQRDLDLTCGFARGAVGNERLDRAPMKAGFFWKRGERLEYSIDLEKNELSTLIKTLESKGIKVPGEFHKALSDFPA
jgi:hypothetical protein